MSDDSEGEKSDWDTFVDADDDSTPEPEIIRWLEMYAEAADDTRDATVGSILGEVNRLLRRYRRESSVYRTDYGSRLRMLTKRMPVLLWTTDTRLRITMVAGGGLAAADIDPSSTVSLPLTVVLGTDTLHPEAMDAHERALQGQPAVFEYDRRSQSYLAHVEPLSDPGGVIVGTIGLAINVTERKRAEEMLARREQQLAEAQRLAQVGSWEFDFTTNRLSWSEEEHRIFGLRREPVPPSREAILARIHPDDREQAGARWDAAIRTGEPYAWDYRIIRSDGEVRVIHGRGVLVRDAAGQAERILGTSQDVTELRRADEAVRATRQMLEHLLNSFPNGAIGVFDADLRYVMAAGSTLAQFGLTPEQAIGKTLAELFPPDAVAVVEGPYRRAFGGETVTVDVPLAGRIFTVSAAPLDRVDGEVRTIVAVAQDVTDRVRAERALAHREAQLAEAQHLAHVGSWEREIATGRLTWSDELYRIYGFAPHEIPASFEAFMEHVHPDDAARVRAINQAAIHAGEPFEYQARILRPNGEVRHYHSRGAVLRDASGRPSRLVGVVQDATERVRAEEAARRQAEAMFEQAELLEQIHDAVIVRGLDGAIQYWNRGAEDLYGWSRIDAVGQVIHSLLQTQFPDTVAAVEAALEAASRWEGELIHTHRDGSQIVVECRMVLMRDPQGHPSKVFVVNRDITQRRTLERQQQELSAMVAHELLRPVTGIELYAELLQMVGAYRAEWVTAIMQSARQLERLVGDLVDASRLQTQYLKLRVEPTHLPEVVRAQAKAVQLSSPSHHLRVEAGDQLPVGQWDRDRVEQICHNLLSNAIKYSSEGSEVVVRVADLGMEAQVSVQDHGIGIAPEAIPHLFERFYRAQATEERAGGLGLGLSITKAFVEAHGGTLTVESVLGQGSTFCFTLPYRGPAGTEEETHASEGESQDLG